MYKILICETVLEKICNKKQPVIPTAYFRCIKLISDHTLMTRAAGDRFARTATRRKSCNSHTYYNHKNK